MSEVERELGKMIAQTDREKSEVKADVTPEALNAAGQSCLALATAIASFAQRDMIDEARELSDQLRLTSKAIRWLIREDRSLDLSGDRRIDTKGIKLDKDSQVCQFISGFLSEGERKAIDVINKTVDCGYSKNEVFKAKEVLKLKTRTKYNNKWWSLPDA